MSVEKPERSAAAIVVGCVGFLIVAGYAGLGMLQGLVLDPLAAVPDMILEEIYIHAARSNETIHVWVVVMLLGPGLLLGFGSLVLSLRRGATWVQSAAVAAGLLFLGGLPFFWASLGVGMNVADAFGTSGGDHTGWDSVIYATSGCAALVLLLLAVLVGVRSGVRAWWGRRAVLAQPEFADSPHSEAKHRTEPHFRDRGASRRTLTPGCRSARREAAP
ncbi:hypothetical protein [Pseudoclavibacter sp. JSM 162008]|uniref:hypothetical protein n=1 Tax=Pseudoclavibacter sp. JSM 162008 TaxID=3229855 RepID=UPI00352642C5